MLFSAHELSHIKNGDSVAKGLAKLARVAFPFDPALRLVEAAFTGARTLGDKASVEFTVKPWHLPLRSLRPTQGLVVRRRVILLDYSWEVAGMDF